MRTDRLRDYLKLLCEELDTAASMIQDKTVSDYLKKLAETYKGKLYEYNFSKFWKKSKTDLNCYSDDTFVYWKIVATNKKSKLEIGILRLIGYIPIQVEDTDF